MELGPRRETFIEYMECPLRGFDLGGHGPYPRCVWFVPQGKGIAVYNVVKMEDLKETFVKSRVPKSSPGRSTFDNPVG